jgi:hypothetical protein
VWVCAIGLRRGWRDGSEDTRPAGEVGFLRHVILSDIDPPKRCFLVMEHMGNTSVVFHLKIRLFVARSTGSYATTAVIAFVRLARST